MVKKLVLAILVIVAMVAFVGLSMAQEETKTEAAAPAMEVAAPAAEAPAASVVVGNKVCPVTGAPITDLSKDTVEYEGKVYNLCMTSCKEEFLKDPKKYIAKVEEELAAEKTAAEPVAAAAPAAAEVSGEMN